MILKSTIREFLKQERNDYTWYKKLTDSELNQRRDRLPVDPPIWNKLKLHQKQGLLLGIRLKKLAYWYATGTGKSVISLALLRYFEEKGTLTRALVLVPNLVNKAEWEQEIQKHSRRTPYAILEGSSKQKLAILEDQDTKLFIETYAGLARMLSTMTKVRMRNGKVKDKLVPDKKLINDLAKTVNMIVLDESGAVGTKASLQHRTIYKLCKQAKYVYLLNGTPFGRDPTPLWGQMRCVDDGDTLGGSLSLFRAVFFKEVPNGFGIDWEFDQSKLQTLRSILRNRSLRYRANEADLPTTVRITKSISIGGDAQEIYDRALLSLRAARGNVTALKNEFMCMRQISSGFIGYKDDTTGKSAQSEFTDKPKLELLLDLLQRITPEAKAVVYNEYTFSGSVICRELRKLEIKHARIYGGTKDTQAELLKFVKDEDCRVLVLNHHAGSMGLNLQVAQYVIYYESPVSPRVRMQADARVARQGSKHERVFIYDLVSGPVDKAILKMHRQGQDLLKAIMDGNYAPLS